MIFRVAGINVHFQMQTSTDLYFLKYIFINPQSVSHPREGLKIVFSPVENKPLLERCRNDATKTVDENLDSITAAVCAWRVIAGTRLTSFTSGLHDVCFSDYTQQCQRCKNKS